MLKVLLKSHSCILHTVLRSLPMVPLSHFQEVWLCSLHTLHLSRSIMKPCLRFMAKATQFCFRRQSIISTINSHSNCRHTARAHTHLNQASPVTAVLHHLLFKAVAKHTTPHIRILLSPLQPLLLFCLSIPQLLRWHFTIWVHKSCITIHMEICLKLLV